MTVAALLVAAGGLAAQTSQAQQVYRIVGPDGRVTFSDKPPTEFNAKVTAGSGGPAGAANGPALPFELRQIAAKYPVTLYTSDACGPCGSARTLLLARGVPFAEKTVNNNDDIQALQRLSGETSLPFATVGSQQLKGFSDAEWTQFLDAAGYPKQSVLPPSYRQPAAAPLVAVVQKAAAPASAAGADARPAARPAPAPAAAPANPAGIRF
ncbi:MAG: glutaredoxin family protein [Polaromonas sp.]|jgi:glutaredoxin|nr:glutaredoxin family protein [Polaromonas sp.]